MASKVTVEEAQAHLKELIEKLAPGEEVEITEDQKPVAKLVGRKASRKQRPGPGLGKEMIQIVSDDDDHLKDFGAYMP